MNGLFVWRFMMCKALLTSLCLSLIVIQRAEATALSDVPIPPGAQVQLIGVDAIHNGRSVSMATFEASHSIETTIAFYNDAWPDPDTGDTPGMIQSRTPEWLLLSHLDGGYNTVVQLSLAQPHLSTGYVSIMPVAQKITSPLTSSIEGLELLSDTQTDDQFSTSRLSVYASSLSVNEISDDMIRARSSGQWLLTSRREFAGSQIATMSSSDKQLEMVVSRSEEGGSTVVINVVSLHD